MNETTGANEPASWEKLEGWDRTFAQMWETVFLPELERRRDAGVLPDDFFLYIAQLLQPPGKPNVVLFNDEVRGYALMRPTRDVALGENALVSDLGQIEHFDLPDDVLDCGHFTIIRSGSGWRMFFNFLSGRAKARDMFGLASQFLEAAEVSAKKGHAGPSVDNLFSAAELTSKAILILHHMSGGESRGHGAVASGINIWAKLGNIEPAFVALFNKLSNQRPNARYSDRGHQPPAPDADSFELVRAMIAEGVERTIRSTDRVERSASKPAID